MTTLPDVIIRLIDRLDRIRWRLRQRTIRRADVDAAASYDLAWVVIRRSWRRTLWVELPRAEMDSLCVLWAADVDTDTERSDP